MLLILPFKLAMRFLSAMLDAHQDKLKTLPLRTAFTLGRFEGENLFDLVEFGAALHDFASQAIVHLRNELQRVYE